MRPARVQIVFQVALLAGLLTAVPATPQSDPAASQIGVAEEELLFLEISSVFTASKFEQEVTDAPARISVVTAYEIERFGYRTLADILRSLPGFHTTLDRNYSYVGIRGFGIPGDYDTKYLLLVNGHRVNDNIYSSADSSLGFVLNVDLIERVEVVRGPNSSLYGSNAFFGVVNVISKNGRDLNGLEIAADGGTFSTARGRLSYGKRYNSGLEMLFSGTLGQSDGNRRLYYAEFDDPASNNGIAEDADDESFGTLFARLSFKGFTLEAAHADREKGIPTASYETVFNDSRTRTRDAHSYLDLSYKMLAADKTDVTARLYFDRFRYTGDWAYDYSDEGDLSDIQLYTDEAAGDWWGSEIQVAHHFKRHRLVAGSEFRSSLREEQTEFDDFEVYLDSRTDSHSWALYLQDEITLSDDLILSLSARHDDYSTVGSSTNPRAALIWSPFEETGLKLLYGTAFRAPNTYEINYQDGDFTQKQAGPLEPETIETWELVLDQQLSKHLRGTASIYSNNIDNLIVLVTDPEDDLLVFENLDEVKSTGAELELNGAWQEGWAGALSYSYQDSQDRATGDPVPNFSTHMVKLNLIAPLAGDDFTAGVEMLFESGRGTLGGADTDPSLVGNLTLRYGKWTSGPALSFSVYNLFDEAYSNPGSAEHVQDQIAQDGRTVRLKAVFTY